MKKVFSDYIYDILSYEAGFIVVYRKAVVDGKVVVSYKSVSLENGLVSQRTKNDYEFIKFGEGYEKIEFQVGNFITCNCVKMDDDRVFAVDTNGDAKILDKDGCVEWQGVIRYKDDGPSSIAQYGHTVWASFAGRNALIRFNLRTMREELRIGGSNDSSFASPEGLWVNEPEGSLIVCNRKANNILEVNMKSYTVKEKISFDEPVRKYMRIGNNELVVLDSGLYLI